MLSHALNTGSHPKRLVGFREKRLLIRGSVVEERKILPFPPQPIPPHSLRAPTHAPCPDEAQRGDMWGETFLDCDELIQKYSKHNRTRLGSKSGFSPTSFSRCVARQRSHGIAVWNQQWIKKVKGNSIALTKAHNPLTCATRCAMRRTQISCDRGPKHSRCSNKPRPRNRSIPGQTRIRREGDPRIPRSSL